MLTGGISEDLILESELQSTVVLVMCSFRTQGSRLPLSKLGLFVLSGGDVSPPQTGALPTAALSCHIAFLSTHSPQVTHDPAVTVSADFHLSH